MLALPTLISPLAILLATIFPAFTSIELIVSAFIFEASIDFAPILSAESVPVVIFEAS